ncbi:MAG: phosphopantothenoylcysteine decarboxylase [Phycisphaerales bacterium]|nr:phosphopantothenoylcysteine decarboxylase [Phycisphaerales bacterium]
MHLLITAGPTYEPIDAVRFLGNRSSGRLGSALADEAARQGWHVTLLLGPNAIEPSDRGIELVRFQSTQDLQDLLDVHLVKCDCLVMAAAVADYRPALDEIDLAGKRKRSGGDITLKLEATPDLLARCSERATQSQLLVGFALEPQERLISSATRKLEQKGIDLIVANELKTMDSNTINATILGNASRGIELSVSTDGAISKAAFASWLLNHLTPIARTRAGISEHASHG